MVIPFFNARRKKMENFLIKKAEAIEQVKFNLKRFYELYSYGLPTVEERIPSFTRSILPIPDGSHSGIDLGSKVTKATAQEMKDKDFFYRYSMILSSLSEKDHEIIHKRYFYHTTIRAFEDGSEMVAGNSRICKKLNDIYLIIACLDEEIDFSFSNYIQCKKLESAIDSNQKAMITIKKQIISYIQPLLLYQIDHKELVLCKKVIDQLPEAEKKIMYEYFSENTHDFTAYQYRLLSRGLFSFAYLHPYIRFETEMYKQLMQKTGGGWKKTYDDCQKKIYQDHEENKFSEIASKNKEVLKKIQNGITQLKLEI